MENEEVLVVQADGSEMFIHQLGSMLAATVVGFAASKLGEKAYFAALAWYRSKH